VTVAGLSTSDIVAEMLSDHARAFGDRPFLVDDVGSHSYAEVDDLADRHADAYAGLGVRPGDTVALFMENSADLAITTFGVNRAGGIWSPVNTDYRGEWLDHTLSAIRSEVLVVDAHLLPQVMELPHLPFRHVVVHSSPEQPAPGASQLDGAAVHTFESFATHDPVRPDLRPYFGDTVSVMWTSGTTGRSKGVMQANGTWTLWSRWYNDVYRGGVRPGERYYGCVPMYNSGGWISNIYSALAAGLTACIDRRFSVTEFWDRLRFYGAHHTMTLGTMHQYLWNAPERADEADNPLRTLMMIPVMPAVMEPFMRRFGIERVYAGFGQSEVMGATTYHSDMRDIAPGSCGYVRDDAPVELRVLDDDDREVPTGEVGELCVRPRRPFAIYSGYFEQPEETARAFRNLWHHTGDLGRVEADGQVYFVDRKKDSIRHKGRNISSFEVEHIARRFPGVAEVVVVGAKLPDFEFEEELMLFVLAEEDTTVDPLELCTFIDTHAPYFFVPRYVEIVDDLPTTPTGKIQKFLLRQRGPGPKTWDLFTDAGGWRPSRTA
jgi:crotonobetaine/carnitine-CoA ligase